MINESLKNAFKEIWKKNLNLLDIAKSDLNSHISNDHPCYYAESSSIGGSAISAEKLDSSAGDSNTPVYFFAGKPVPCTSLDLNTSGNAAKATALTTSAGSATNPIYFSEGKPAACTYTLGKSVPSNAVFTDTDTKVTNTLNSTVKAYITGTTSASTNTGTQVFDTGVYLGTTAGELIANKFIGALSGNATSATTASNLSGFTNHTTTNTALDNMTNNGIWYTCSNTIPNSAANSIYDGMVTVNAYNTNWIT